MNDALLQVVRLVTHQRRHARLRLAIGSHAKHKPGSDCPVQLGITDRGIH